VIFTNDLKYQHFWTEKSEEQLLLRASDFFNSEGVLVLANWAV
jgi:hypothetical protein